MPPAVSHYAQVHAYITKDGSLIRELMHPQVHGNRAQSLAEAVVPAGQRTVLHYHRRSEELYHVTAGRGRLTLLGDAQFEIGPGDTVHIAPGTPHALHNPGPEDLRVLCCSAPAYDHADTVLLGGQTTSTRGSPHSR